MQRKEDFVLHQVGRQNVLVPIGARVMDMNGLVTLNETGAYIWELLAEPRTADELAAAVADEFDVGVTTARADVQAFIDTISEMGLLEM